MKEQQQVCRSLLELELGHYRKRRQEPLQAPHQTRELRMNLHRLVHVSVYFCLLFPSLCWECYPGELVEACFHLTRTLRSETKGQEQASSPRQEQVY
mmetsp:Transcript_49703/g.143035  ORF Transcript_49703/g.143035 Transcript_49703/m.143035 type:complete len:97 (+) Transcript_49703:416-706(+)